MPSPGRPRTSASPTSIRAVDGPLANVRGERVETVEYEGNARALRDVWVRRPRQPAPGARDDQPAGRRRRPPARARARADDRSRGLDFAQPTATRRGRRSRTETGPLVASRASRAAISASWLNSSTSTRRRPSGAPGRPRAAPRRAACSRWRTGCRAGSRRSRRPSPPAGSSCRSRRSRRPSRTGRCHGDLLLVVVVGSIQRRRTVPRKPSRPQFGSISYSAVTSGRRPTSPASTYGSVKSWSAMRRFS